MSQQCERNKPITTGEEIAAFRRVKLDGATAIYADAGDPGIGVCQALTASGATANIRLDNGGGTSKMVAAAAIAAGKRVYPAADGKVSPIPSGPSVGKTLEAATAANDVIEVLLEKDDLFLEGYTFEEIAANKTLDAEDDGECFYVTADAKTITLPATAAGIDVIIINGAADGTVAVNISPNANDKIMGPDIAGTDNKDQINTKTTALLHDYLHIVADGTNGWFIKGMRGTWAEEA